MLRAQHPSLTPAEDSFRKGVGPKAPRWCRRHHSKLRMIPARHSIVIRPLRWCRRHRSFLLVCELTSYSFTIASGRRHHGAPKRHHSNCTMRVETHAYVLCAARSRRVHNSPTHNIYHDACVTRHKTHLFELGYTAKVSRILQIHGKTLAFV